jgi:hypothetical protein
MDTGDPDSGLNLRQEFKEELSRRLKGTGPRISSKEVENLISINNN